MGNGTDFANDNEYDRFDFVKYMKKNWDTEEEEREYMPKKSLFPKYYLSRKITQWLHSPLFAVLGGYNKYQLHYLNEHPLLQGNAIYAANHGGKYDAPCCGQAISEHMWLLVGKQRLELMDRLFFLANGVVWIDRKDKASRNKGARKMLELVKAGENLCMFPEGTWNIYPSLPMLPMSWGVIELSAQSKRPIVPILLEYRGTECYVKYGEPFYCDEKETKKRQITELRDRMATLRWEIWESFPLQKRKDVADDEWDNEIAKRLAEYPKLNYEYEQSCIRTTV